MTITFFLHLLVGLWVSKDVFVVKIVWVYTPSGMQELHMWINTLE